MSGQNNSSVLGAVWSAKRVWLLHLAGNLALAVAAYGWLWIPDARAWQLAATAVTGVAIVAAVLWLHGATLAFFRGVHSGHETKLRSAFRKTVGKLPALAAWLLILLAALWAVGWIEDQTGNWSAWWASWLTLKRQKPVLVQSVSKFFFGAVWVLRWIVVPVILLPLAVRATQDGLAGLRELQGAKRAFQRGRFWLIYAAVLVFGWFVPGFLTGWVPQVKGFSVETFSMVARLLPAYLLMVTSWLVLLSLLARCDASSYDSAQVAKPAPAAPRESSSTAAVTPGE